MVNYASSEDLIIHKLVAGRPRDIEDIESILAKIKNINTKYIYKWPGMFDKSLSLNFSGKFKKLYAGRFG